MRFLLLSIGFIGFFVMPVTAQTYYNAPNASGAGTLYNAPSGNSFKSQSPINIQGMLKGKNTRSTGRTGYTYQGRPYGVDRSSYSLALSPEEARRNNAERARVAAQREREKQSQRTKLEAKNRYSLRSETDQYLDQLRSRGGQKASSQQVQRKRVLYNQDRTGLSVPKRVFNSPY